MCRLLIFKAYLIPKHNTHVKNTTRHTARPPPNPVYGFVVVGTAHTQFVILLNSIGTQFVKPLLLKNLKHTNARTHEQKTKKTSKVMPCALYPACFTVCPPRRRLFSVPSAAEPLATRDARGAVPTSPPAPPPPRPSPPPHSFPAGAFQAHPACPARPLVRPVRLRLCGQSALAPR